jgi:hypothetical protein
MGSRASLGFQISRRAAIRESCTDLRHQRIQILTVWPLKFVLFVAILGNERV